MNPTDSKEIPSQVKLPLKIAFAVVIQGLKIRLGRSVVTITGVTCGIAFLMSILTGQLVKRGVSEEDQIRADVGRELSFISAGLPQLKGKTISVVGSGELSEIETRVLNTLADERGVSSIIFDSSASPSVKRPVSKMKRGNASDASILFVMGTSEVPHFDFKGFVKKDIRNMIASTAQKRVNGTDGGEVVTAASLGVGDEYFVQVARKMSSEEISSMRANKSKERFRSVWIGVISLLVTVIGIANAMLMSVTERFREIGTMKCLGALSSFVTRMFVLEASIMGLVGGLAGAVFGAIFAIIIYTFTYGADLVFGSMPIGSLLLFGLYSTIAGIVLSVIAAIYPARVAAAMVPATALRSNV